jgi:hypothetical protein
MYDQGRQQTHHFWEVAASREHPNGYESLALPYTLDPTLPHTLSAH